MSPISLDGKEPGENTFLNYGLYNLGFIGIHRNCTNPGGFLDWWENRILNVGFHDACNGFFVDQLWINFVPLFYEKVRILRLPGIDVGPWNLHERKIQEKEPGKFKMDDGSPLYFFHFSTFRFKEPGKMSTYYNRYDFETNPELKKIYTDYYAHLMANKIEQFAAINCKYVERRNQYIESQAVVPSKAAQIVKKIKSGIKLFIPPVILKIKNSLN